MRKSKIVRAALVGLAALGIALPSAAAHQLDRYSNMLSERNCTIRYENITPGELVHARGLVSMEYGYQSKQPQRFVNQPYHGTVVLKGTESYIDVDYGDYGSSHLRKGKDVYRFARTVSKKKKITYLDSNGAKARELAAKPYREEKDLLYGEDFGTKSVSHLLTAMLPAKDKPEGMPSYAFVDDGTLDSGLSFEDYRASSARGLEAIRYYFKDGQLTKIASVSYTRNDKGELVGWKCVLKIDEFSGQPDETLLSLPQGIKAKK